MGANVGEARGADQDGICVPSHQPLLLEGGGPLNALGASSMGSGDGIPWDLKKLRYKLQGRGQAHPGFLGCSPSLIPSPVLLPFLTSHLAS